MRKFEVNPGDTFNQFTVILEVESLLGRRQCLCKCSCGSDPKVVRLDCLRDGRTKTCGCSHITHGVSDRSIPEYRVWAAIKERCGNPNNRSYQDYGARGIKMCERWNDFAAFLEDMERKPTEQHTIDRIDNDGNYEPGNCRWATRTQQARNKSTTKMLVFNGEERPMVEWAEMYGIEYKTLFNRIEYGKWSVERALTTPAIKGNNGSNY
jgi:hypothetical protein